MTVYPDAMKCEKAEFCKALAAEGIPVTVSYRHIQCEADWFINQHVFGKTGYPWQCSDYKGPKHPKYDMPNAIFAANTNFNIAINESYGEQETKDIIDALNKVSEYYAK